MTYDTVYFDWGGVIADDPGDDFLVRLLGEVGATQAQTKAIMASSMGDFMRGRISETDYWQRLRQQHGLTIPVNISEAFQRWRGLQANSAMLELVDTVKAAGLQVALLTNVIEPTYNVLQRAGYYDRFDVVVASCKLGLAKPDLALYRRALALLETTAEQSIFIDDKAANLQPAQALGMTTILATSPAQIEHDVRLLLHL